eukprot:scaffold438298_cov37-Prasinocladus_malaysianus.AAC.1
MSPARLPRQRTQRVSLLVLVRPIINRQAKGDDDEGERRNTTSTRTVCYETRNSTEQTLPYENSLWYGERRREVEAVKTRLKPPNSDIATNNWLKELTNFAAQSTFTFGLVGAIVSNLVCFRSVYSVMSPVMTMISRRNFKALAICALMGLLLIFCSTSSAAARNVLQSAPSSEAAIVRRGTICTALTWNDRPIICVDEFMTVENKNGFQIFKCNCENPRYAPPDGKTVKLEGFYCAMRGADGTFRFTYDSKNIVTPTGKIKLTCIVKGNSGKNDDDK